MTIKKKVNEKGFTIIEVALVLAVAALIFLVVFLAVPAMQRNQRNDARKRDAANLLAAITTFAANNQTGVNTFFTSSNGSFVAITAGKPAGSIGSYLDSTSINVSSILVTTASAPSTEGVSVLTLHKGWTCNSTGTMTAVSGAFAVTAKLETAGTATQVYCQSA